MEHGLGLLLQSVLFQDLQGQKAFQPSVDCLSASTKLFARARRSIWYQKESDPFGPTGEVTGAGVPDIHQLGNPEVSGQDLVTIHVYAPPLGVLKTYKVGSPIVDLYTPNDFPTD